MNKFNSYGTVGTYRNDWDDEKAFMYEIMIGHVKQAIVIERLKKHMKEQYNREIVVEDNGVDNSGEFVERATGAADVVINNVLTEIKTVNQLKAEFEIKSSNIFSYIKQGAHMIVVNGFGNQEYSRVAVLTPEQLKDAYINNPRTIKFGYKEAIVFNARDYKWERFATIDPEHELYKKLHKLEEEFRNYRKEKGLKRKQSA